MHLHRSATLVSHLRTSHMDELCLRRKFSHPSPSIHLKLGHLPMRTTAPIHPLPHSLPSSALQTSRHTRPRHHLRRPPATLGPTSTPIRAAAATAVARPCPVYAPLVPPVRVPRAAVAPASGTASRDPATESNSTVADLGADTAKRAASVLVTRRAAKTSNINTKRARPGAKVSSCGDEGREKQRRDDGKISLTFLLQFTHTEGYRQPLFSCVCYYSITICRRLCSDNDLFGFVIIIILLHMLNSHTPYPVRFFLRGWTEPPWRTPRDIPHSGSWPVARSLVAYGGYSQPHRVC